MKWDVLERIFLITVFVAAGLAALSMQAKEAAYTLFGAAAGYVGQNARSSMRSSSSSSSSSPSSIPPRPPGTGGGG